MEQSRGAADVLWDLAAQSATGRLVLNHPDGSSSWLWLRDGLLCSISTPGQDDLLGPTLLQQGVLSANQLAQLLASCRESGKGDLSAVAITSGMVAAATMYQIRADLLGQALHRALDAAATTSQFLRGEVFPTLTQPVAVADAWAHRSAPAPAPPATPMPTPTPVPAPTLAEVHDLRDSRQKAEPPPMPPPPEPKTVEPSPDLALLAQTLAEQPTPPPPEPAPAPAPPVPEPEPETEVEPPPAAASIPQPTSRRSMREAMRELAELDRENLTDD